jgi:hypothetical protein
MKESRTLLGWVVCSLIFTAALIPSALAAAPSDASKPNYPGNKAPLAPNKFIRLPFGSVMAEGWLARQLRIEADGLARHLLDPVMFDQVLGPCKENGISEITYQSGVYQEGLITLAWMTGDPVFLKRAKEAMEKTLAESPEALGTTDDEARGIMYIRGRQTRAFIEYYEATKDPRVLTWLTRFFHAWGKSDLKYSWWVEAATTDLFVVGVWLYDRTGDPVVLDTIRAKSGFSEKVVASFLDFPRGEYERHNVVIAWISRLPGILYELSADPRLRKATFDGIDGRDKWFGQIGGRYTGHEHFTKKIEDGRRPTNGTELCGVVEYMYSMEKLFEIFGEVSLADRLELLAYNSLPGACTGDYFFHQYDQQANQVDVSPAKRGFDNNEAANIYGVAPHYPCCSFNMHHAWPRFVEHLWMATPDVGLAAAAYGPSRVAAKAGDGRDVTIVETTEYPFDGEIRFKIETAGPVSFPLYLRVPAWADGATLMAGGHPVTCKAGEMAKVERLWKSGDECVLSLPMRVRTEARFNKAVGVMRGPLYFSLRIGKRYGDLGQDQYWGILPTTPWNYALDLGADGATLNAAVVRNPIGDFPFAEKDEPVHRRAKDAVILPDGRISSYDKQPYAGAEPVILRVKGRLLAQWGMDKIYPANAADPPMSPVVGEGPLVDLELIPYGCARLRISEFPWSKE